MERSLERRTEGSTLLMTLLGREMPACIEVCCIEVPARILPLFVTGIWDELTV